MRTALLKIAPFLLAVLLGASCSKSNTQMVTVSFPDWTQLQSSTYERQSRMSSPAASASITNAALISVSVGSRVISGFPWEQTAGNPTPPTNVSFEVETGSLVQALAILETSNGARVYYYGDAKVTQSGQLDIDLTNVLTTTAGEGKVIGRYMTGVDANARPVGPTGVFQYRFDVASVVSSLADRPAMVVTTGEIFNGWMSATTLPNRALKYTNVDGSPAFGLSSDDNSMISTSQSARAARVVVPASYRNEKWDGTYDMKYEPRTDYVLGYFGPAADSIAQSSGLRLCYPEIGSWTGATTVPQLFKDLAASGQATDAPQTPLKWAGSLSTVPTADLPRTARVVAGGENGSSTACTTASNLYSSVLKVDVQTLASSDEFVGLRGPFARLASGRFADSAYDSANQRLTVQWSALPDVATVLSGFSVFYRTVASQSDDAIRVMDGYNCEAMHNRSKGFEDFKEVQVSSTAATATIAGVVDSVAAANLQVITCPRAKDGTLYKSGVMAYLPGGQTSTPPTELRLITADGQTTSALNPRLNGPNICFPITIHATDSAGNDRWLSSSTTLSVSVNAGVSGSISDTAYTLYDGDSSCSTAGASTISVNGFNGGARKIYVRAADPSEHTFHVKVTDTASAGLGDARYFGHQLTSGQISSTVAMVAVPPPVLYAQSCTPIDFAFVDPNTTGQPLVGVTTNTFFYTPMFGGQGGIYRANDPTCDNAGYPLGFLTPTVGLNSVSAYIKYTGTTTDVSVTLSQDPPTTALPPAAFSIPVQQPGAPVAASLRLVTSAIAGNVNPVKIIVWDALGHQTTNTTGQSFEVAVTSSAPGSFIATDGSSNLGTTAVITVPVGQSEVRFFYQPTNSGAQILTPVQQSGSTLALQPLTITVAAISPTSLGLRGPGQAYDLMNGVTGLIQQVDPDVVYTYYAYAYTPAGLANGTNGTVAENETLSLMTNLSGMTFVSPTATFVNGVAAVQVRFAPSLAGQTVNADIGFMGSVYSTGWYSYSTTNTPVSAYATRAVIYGNSIANAGICQPLLVAFDDGSGHARPAPSNWIAAQSNLFQSDGSTYALGDWGVGGGAELCASTGGGAGSISTPIASSSRSFTNYFRYASSQSGQINFTNANFGSVTLPVTVGGTPPGAPGRLAIYGSSSPEVNTCTPYLIDVQDTNGVSVATATAVSDITIGNGGAFMFQTFSDPSCSNAQTSFSVSASQHAVVFYLKATSPSGGGYLQALSNSYVQAPPLTVNPQAL